MNHRQLGLQPAGGSKTALPPWADSGIASHQEPKVAFPVEAELSALTLASGSPGEKQIYILLFSPDPPPGALPRAQLSGPSA